MRFSVNTLGCRANLCESDEISRELEKSGFQKVDYRAGKPQFCIINTCTITSEADRKVRQLLRRIKKTNPDAKMVVTGCFVRQNRSFLKDNKVDLIIDNEKKDDIYSMASEIAEFMGEKQELIEPGKKPGRIYNSQSDPRIWYHSRPMVKIQDGCEQYCSYCIIPMTRGKYRSVESKSVINKVDAMEKAGFDEIVLTGINIGKYGLDIEGKRGLPRLLEQLINKTDIKRIRISSIEVNDIDDRLLSVLSGNSERFAPHLHIPLQSGSDSILKFMRRPYSSKFFMEKISKIRKLFPDIAITTDVMVGFPSETEEDFNNSLSFVKAAGFARLHVFKFSSRPGTAASRMDNKVEAFIKNERSSLIREIGRRLRNNYIEYNIGKNLDVVVEKTDSEKSLLSGISGNYIKVYFREVIDYSSLRGKIIRLKTEKKFRDGLFAAAAPE
jgi:threonylcarbamoyladenosine tRNA methylthiotransferase MtaB